MDNQFIEIDDDIEAKSMFTTFPDWLILSAFDKMDNEQQLRCKDRYIELMRDKKQYDENMFTDMLNKSIDNTPTIACTNPYCVGGKLIKGNVFLGYCDCSKPNTKQSLIDNSNMPINLRTKKMYDFKTKDDEQAEIKKRLRDKLIDFDLEDNEPISCLFLGKSMRGKTHLASSIANLYLDNEVAVKFYNYEKFIFDVKNNIKDSIYQDKVFKVCTTIKVLYIDDLFSTKASDTDIKLIYRIMNERLINNMPIIITSRLSFNDFSNYYPNVFSKVYELVQGNIFEFKMDKQLNF